MDGTKKLCSQVRFLENCCGAQTVVFLVIVVLAVLPPLANTKMGKDVEQEWS